MQQTDDTRLLVVEAEQQVAFCPDGELREGDYWIYRFMLAARFQGQGYGKLAFDAIVKKIKGLGAQRIMTLCRPDNQIACYLYRQAGFTDSGKLDDGDILFEYPVLSVSDDAGKSR